MLAELTPKSSVDLDQAAAQNASFCGLEASVFAGPFAMQKEKPETSVSAAEISRNFGTWQDRASQGAVVVTHHGRRRVVLMPIDEFEGLSKLPQRSQQSELSAARLAVLAEHVTGGFVVFDKDLRFTRINAEAEIHFGWSANTLLGKSVRNADLGEYEGPVMAALDRVANGGEELMIDTPSVIQSGRILRIRMLPYPSGVAVIFRNVAHERKIEHEGYEREALYAARNVHANIAVARLSLRGTFEKAEPGLARIVGMPAERLQGMRLTDLLTVRGRGEVSDEIDAALNGETRRFLSRMVVDAGVEIAVCVAVAPIRENYGIVGAMIMLTVEERTSS